MWICLSDRVLKYLANLKEEFDAAVESQISMQYKLNQDISMFVDIYKDPL